MSRKARYFGISRRTRVTLFIVLLALAIVLRCFFGTPKYQVSLSEIPEYSGKAYAVINGNVPFFEVDYDIEEYESYDELDIYGRAVGAIACLGVGTMPKDDEVREDISKVKPTAWHTAKYDIVEGEYLYNRSHLIGWQLSAENDNPKNLITGTRYFNTEGMLPFENAVKDYILKYGGRVLYRVTPIYNKNELLARGVLIEAKSLDGDGLQFCVFVYNVQPGISIDYLDGESRLLK